MHITTKDELERRFPWLTDEDAEANGGDAVDEIRRWHNSVSTKVREHTELLEGPPNPITDQEQMRSALVTMGAWGDLNTALDYKLGPVVESLINQMRLLMNGLDDDQAKRLAAGALCDATSGMMLEFADPALREILETLKGLAATKPDPKVH